MPSPIHRAHTFGQSIWLDNISRDLILSGELRRRVEQGGVRGVTSNPAIFEKAIAGTSDYDAAARALLDQGARDALDVFERLAVADIALGCDVLRPIWEESGGRDGFVSLEVSPHLANDTEGTIEEAHRLARAVSRENLMIKVPATPEGIPAIERLIADGLNVNVTLLFSIEAYEAVHQAYLAGLEARVARGLPVASAHSVASFFVSRIDAAVAREIESALAKETDAARRARLEALDARVAIANAKLAYAHFLETLAGERWQRLSEAGAHPQRVLWASTGTKDPSLPRTLYVDGLIGQHTVNTLPDATLEAFREEGIARDALGRDPEPLRTEAREVLGELEALGISLKAITDSLLTQGCTLFTEAFERLLLSVETKRQSLIGDRLPRMHAALGELTDEVAAAARSWQAEDRTRKLWERRAEIFSDADEASWMGWLDLPAASPDEAIGASVLREAIRRHPADTIVVVGMGGSSLWPDVLGRTFGPRASDAPHVSGVGHAPLRRLEVIDTTVPDAIESILSRLTLDRCLFVIASKSGSTIEPNAIFELLHARLSEQVGAQAAGRHFVAITDPGSALEARAEELGFLGTALGRPDVGGRFSALSPFGLLPAEAMGLDAEALQARARLMSAACERFVPPEQNPGVALGLALGTLARLGRDKLTLSSSPAIASFSGWVEQLIAESTGKQGRGVVPIAGEPLGDAGQESDDRVFVDIRLADDAELPTREKALARLEALGHPVLRIRLADRLDLVQEVFRWEIATAVIGSILGCNPFDQPDVEAAKIASRKLMKEAGAGGALPSREADLEVEGARLFLSPALADSRPTGSDSGSDPAAWMGALLASLGPGDTFVINAFLEDAAVAPDAGSLGEAAAIEVSDTTRAVLQRIREAVGRHAKVATTLDFGPRYLHSTGQLQKGGPDRMAGLQLWQSAASRAAGPLPIPEMGGDFAVLAEAQAAGDFAVLCERGRRMIGIDVGADPTNTLSRLLDWIEQALSRA